MSINPLISFNCSNSSQNARIWCWTRIQASLHNFYRSSVDLSQIILLTSIERTLHVIPTNILAPRCTLPHRQSRHTRSPSSRADIIALPILLITWNIGTFFEWFPSAVFFKLFKLKRNDDSLWSVALQKFFSSLCKSTATFSDHISYWMKQLHNNTSNDFLIELRSSHRGARACDSWLPHNSVIMFWILSDSKLVLTLGQCYTPPKQVRLILYWDQNPISILWIQLNARNPLQPQKWNRDWNVHHSQST